MQTEVDLIAHSLEKKYDPNAFLGRLCWYTIGGDIRITHTVLTACFDEAFKDVDVKLGGIPRVRSVDVFKRACAAAQQRKYIPTVQECKVVLSMWVAGVTEISHINYLIRAAGSDETHVWRVLIRETVDTQGHEIGYDEVAKIQYNRTTNDITITKNDAVESIDVEDQILHSITQYFLDETTIVTPYAIREHTRKGLERRLRSIKVRPSGGIYFTQEQFSQPLAALETVINTIGGSFHTLPLLDDSKQREMLKTAFQDETISEISEMMDEMTTILKGDKKITLDRFADMKVRFDTQRTKIVEYSELLDEAMEQSASYLELAKAQMGALIDKVDIDVDYD